LFVIQTNKSALIEKYINGPASCAASPELLL
jgi:hypothetical protein